MASGLAVSRQASTTGGLLSSSAIRTRRGRTDWNTDPFSGHARRSGGFPQRQQQQQQAQAASPYLSVVMSPFPGTRMHMMLRRRRHRLPRKQAASSKQQRHGENRKQTPPRDASVMPCDTNSLLAVGGVGIYSTTHLISVVPLRKKDAKGQKHDIHPNRDRSQRARATTLARTHAHATHMLLTPTHAQPVIPLESSEILHFFLSI